MPVVPGPRRSTLKITLAHGPGQPAGGVYSNSGSNIGSPKYPVSTSWNSSTTHGVMPSRGTRGSTDSAFIGGAAVGATCACNAGLLAKPPATMAPQIRKVRWVRFCMLMALPR